MGSFTNESMLGIFTHALCTRETQAKVTGGLSSRAVFVSGTAGSSGTLRAVSCCCSNELGSHSIYSILYILYGYSI